MRTVALKVRTVFFITRCTTLNAPRTRLLTIWSPYQFQEVITKLKSMRSIERRIYARIEIFRRVADITTVRSTEVPQKTNRLVKKVKS